MHQFRVIAKKRLIFTLLVNNVNSVTKKNKRTLTDICNSHQNNISFLYIDDSFDSFKRAAKHISIETNFRLKIASLIPNVEKCIYLDSDLILTENISKLWMQDIDDYYFAAVTDKKVGFNAGVLLINLKKWREDNLEKKFFEYAKENMSHLRSVD